VRSIAIALLTLLIALAAGPAEPAAKRAGKGLPKKPSATRKASKKTSKPKSVAKPGSCKSASPDDKTPRPSKSGKPDAQTNEQTAPAKTGSTAGTSSSVPEGCYTSLVIDATGLKLDKGMTSKIFRKDGSEVWGTLKNLKEEDYAILDERGMVGYAATIEEAKANPRCGSRPLIVRAVDTQGTPLRSNTVVSDEDAERILAENAKSKFLDKFNVILIRNECPPAAPVPPPQDQSSPPPSSDSQPSASGH